MSDIHSGTTAVIVNYFSAQYSLRAVESILASASLGPVNVAVVDNSCDSREKNILQSGLNHKVKLIVNKENIGFGRACNEVFKQSRDPFFLLLNPDALLVGDALKEMQSTLIKHTRAGAVSPQAFWDDSLRFFIPPAHLPALFIFQPELMRMGVGSVLYRVVSRLWRRKSINVWRSCRPINVGNLCGGHVLLKRRAVLESGGLFDPDFFLYFEDADLFLRLRGVGYKLIIDPHAKAVHYYDQCDPENREKKRLMMKSSYTLFIQKNKKKWHDYGNKLIRMLTSKNWHPKELSPIYLHNPYRIKTPEDLCEKKWLLEWSPNPDFIPSVGYFGQGKIFSFPDSCVSKLAPGKYYIRFGEQKIYGQISQVFCWEKH